MDRNFAAWMIAGGPRFETHASQREREQLDALRESQRTEQIDRPGLAARIRALVTSTEAEPEVACYPA